MKKIMIWMTIALLIVLPVFAGWGFIKLAGPGGEPVLPPPEIKFCNQCGDGLFNLCDREECYSATGQTCYFVDGFFSNTCTACDPSATCESYNGDQQSCSDNRCGLGDCGWESSGCYTPLQPQDYCGDGNCDAGEDHSTCPEDCPEVALQNDSNGTTTIYLGEGLSLSLDTYLTQDPGDIKFFVMKNNPPTHRADKFGLAGVHGLWDTSKYHRDWFNEHYGVNKTGEEYLEKHFAMVKVLGVKWIAMGLIWSAMNKRDGVYEWDKFDVVFDMAEEYGLQIVTTLEGTPCWVNAIDDCTCGYKDLACLCYQSNSGCDGMGLACTWRSKMTCCKPLDLSPSEGSPHFNEFVRRAVERYKPYGTKNPTNGYGITNWVIWNEPDWWFWKDCEKQTDASMEEYCQLFNGAALKIREADPDAHVLHGGVTGLAMSQLLGSIDDIETYCDADLYDLYNIHHYMHIDNMRSNLDQVLNSRDDQAKDMWLTEFGWHDAGKMPEDEKREYMLKAMNDIDSLELDGMTKALWWDSRGYPSVPGDEWSTDSALMAGNYYPFPSYFTYGEFMETIVKKGEVVAVVVNQKVEADLPSSLFNEVGDYTVFYASESKMITALPIKVRVVNPGDSCFDSDGGVEVYTKGYATSLISGRTLNDQCSGNTLKEAFCAGQTPYPCNSYDDLCYNYDTCPGGCEDGVCKAPPPPPPTCFDSDGGVEVYTKGYATSLISGRTLNDQCNGNTLKEAFCAGQTTYPCNSYDDLCYSYETCPDGCGDGACY